MSKLNDTTGPNSFINGLILEPKKGVLLLLIITAGLFSIVTLCLAFILTLAAWCFFKVSIRIRILSLLSMGGFILLLHLIIIGYAAPWLHQLNIALFYNLLKGQGDWPSFYEYLIALPYSLLLSGILLSITLWPPPSLHQQVQKIGKGQSIPPKKLLSDNQQLRLLKGLKAAYPNGTLLGINQATGKSVRLTDQNANLHTLAIGTTGSGKTTALGNMIESAIQRKLPLFIIDGKGDLALAHRVQAFAQSQNRPFYLFSMIGKSCKYNPLASGGFTAKKDRIIELRHWSEDHYRKCAEGYLQLVLKILDELSIPVDLYQLGQYCEPEKLYALARPYKGTDVMDSIEQLEKNHSQVTSLIAEIENIVASEIGHLFDCANGNVLTVQRVIEEKAVAYFCLQPLAFPAYAELLGKLIINDLKALIATQLARPNKPIIYTLFDEFSVFAGDPIIHLINQGRSGGIHAVLSTQSLSDLSRAGGEAFLGQVLNNVNNYLIQRQNNPNDAEQLAQLIGTADEFAITSQIAGPGVSNSGSVRSVKEFIIHPDQIKRLRLGEAILVNKAQFQVQRVRLRQGII